MTKAEPRMTAAAAAGLGAIATPVLAGTLALAWLHLQAKPDFVLSKTPVWAGIVGGVLVGPGIGVLVASRRDGGRTA